MVILKKIVLNDDYEYLDPHQIFDESDSKSFEMYTLAKVCSDVLNYYIENTPDAFGNAPYARLDGFMCGYILGRGMELERGKDVWNIRKGKRVILRIEVPKKPQEYYEAVKDNAETFRKVFG